MRAYFIHKGGTYIAKVSGKLVTVRVDDIREVYNRNKFVTWYGVTNMATGRRLTFRSPQKFREAITTKTTEGTI